MPAWSSSTGKPQLSYADRLRHASKSSASPNHDSLSAAAASSSSSAFAPSSSHPPSATDASKHNASLIQRPDSTSTSPHTKQSPGNATTPAHAHAHPTSSTEATTAPSHASTTARNDAAPTLNVWEARRKQIAEREAEKSRERQQSPAHQRNDPPSSKASIATAASNPNHAATKHKLATAPLATAASSKKGPKPSSNPTASDKKNTKPTNQSATANPASASSQPASSLSDTKNASASASSSFIAPSAAKPTTSQASQALEVTREHSSKPPTRHPASSTPSALANSADKPSAQPKDTSNHGDNKEHRARREPAQFNSASEKGTAVRAQSASTTSSRQPAPTPMPMHDDIPGSPATVASAIEEVLKNGGPNGAQTEDDDAWLARIHLLNGGQNMPKFGGIGPNGALGLGGEEEAQAAKKAERAVAAAWGAGKSVWNKSQQHNAQHAAPANKQSAAPPADTSTDQPATSAELRDEVVRVVADMPPASSSTAAQVAGDAATTKVADAGKATPAKSTKASATASATKPDPAAGTSGKKAKDEATKPSKAASHTKTPAASVPSFEDVDNWPSPLDAGKKPVVDRAKPITAAAAPADKDARDAGAKSATPAKAKSFYETLDELQLRLAPGAHPQPAGASAGARKGKQQWVSILPDITHAASGSAAKPARTVGEAKPGKSGKQARKEGHKASTAGAQQTKGDKDATAKGKAAKQRQGGEAPNSASAKGGAAKTSKAQSSKDAVAPQPTSATEEASARPQEAAPGAVAVVEQPAVSAGAVAAQSESGSKSARPARSVARAANGAPPAPTLASLPNGVRAPRSGASSGTHTPAGTRGSPRASVSSPPTAYPAAPLYFPPAAAGAPVMGGSWLPYASFAPAVVYESTAQTGAPVPAGVQGQLLAQVEFYFSTRNLQGDFFLRQKMDGQGWVGVDTIAEFRRVQAVTSDAGVLLDALRASAVLDVDAAARRVRKRFGWQAWVLPEQQQQVQVQGQTQVQAEDEPALGVVAADGIASNPSS